MNYSFSFFKKNYIICIGRIAINELIISSNKWIKLEKNHILYHIF